MDLVLNYECYAQRRLLLPLETSSCTFIIYKKDESTRVGHCQLQRDKFLPLTLGSGSGGERWGAGNLAPVGQDAEDGGLKRCQDEENLAQKQREVWEVPSKAGT